MRVVPVGQARVAVSGLNGGLGARVEADRLEENRLFVVAEKVEIEVSTLLEALARLRPVPDDIAEAVDRIDPLLLDVLERRLKRDEIGVDVGNDGSSQRRSSRHGRSHPMLGYLTRHFTLKWSPAPGIGGMRPARDLPRSSRRSRRRTIPRS